MRGGTGRMNEQSQAGRDALVTAITQFLAAGQDERALHGIRDALVREIDDAGPRALLRLDKRLADAGADWSYYRRDPLARRIHYFLAERVLERGSVLYGTEHVATIAGEPAVIVANHLSYSDANLLEVLLRRSGCGAFADRLTVIAGPKVYSSLERRFSSLCFGTIETPQSSALSSEDEIMNAREVAWAARRSIDIAHERLRLGEALLVFAEGTRKPYERTAAVADRRDALLRWSGHLGAAGRDYWLGGVVSHRGRRRSSGVRVRASRRPDSGGSAARPDGRRPPSHDGCCWPCDSGCTAIGVPRLLQRPRG